MSIWLSNDFLSQTANNLDTVLKVEPQGQEVFYPWGRDWGPSGCRQLLSPGHIRSVSACLIWALKTWEFTHVRSQIPGALPSATHSTLMPSSLTLFQVEVLLIWSQITSSTIIKLSPRIQTHTCIRKTYSSSIFSSILMLSKALFALWQYHNTFSKEDSC